MTSGDYKVFRECLYCGKSFLVKVHVSEGVVEVPKGRVTCSRQCSRAYDRRELLNLSDLRLWRKAEDDLLRSMAGFVSFGELVKAFNQWAADEDGVYRSPESIHSRMTRLKLQQGRPLDSYNATHLARLLNVSRTRVGLWLERGLLAARRMGRLSLIERRDICAFITEHPKELAGASLEGLSWFIGTDAAANLLSLYPRAHNWPIPVIRLPDEMRFPSIEAAAAYMKVPGAQLRNSIKSGHRCHGYYFVREEDYLSDLYASDFRIGNGVGGPDRTKGPVGSRPVLPGGEHRPEVGLGRRGQDGPPGQHPGTDGVAVADGKSIKGQRRKGPGSSPDTPTQGTPPAPILVNTPTIATIEKEEKPPMNYADDRKPSRCCKPGMHVMRVGAYIDPSPDRGRSDGRSKPIFRDKRGRVVGEVERRSNGNFYVPVQWNNAPGRTEFICLIHLMRTDEKGQRIPWHAPFEQEVAS